MATIIFDFDSTLYAEKLHGNYLEIMYAHALERMQIPKARQYIVDYIAPHAPKTPGFYSQLIGDIHQKYAVKIEEKDVEIAIEKIKAARTKGIKKIVQSVKKSGHKVLIVGGAALGIHVIPQIVEEYKIEASNIYSGIFHGIEDAPLHRALKAPFRYVNAEKPTLPTPISEKKSAIINHIRREKIGNDRVILIGDGQNDLEAWHAGSLDAFVGFGLHRKDPKVAREAPFFVENIGDLERVIDALLMPQKTKRKA